MYIGKLKAKSHSDMKNNYGFAILAMILLGLVSIGSIFVGLGIGGIIAAGGVACCVKTVYLSIAKHKIVGVNSVYDGFRHFGKALGVFLILFAISLATLLIITLLRDVVRTGIIALLLFLVVSIASVIVTVRLSMVFYIMVEQTELSAGQCLKKSWQITKKHAWKLIFLELSFIGWWILVGLTFFGLYLYVAPYYETTKANTYMALEELYQAKTSI